jgi:hypothetical protein
MPTATPQRYYVFSERATVYELTLALEERLRQELAALSAEVLLSRCVEDVAEAFIQCYKFDTPKLDRDGITELPIQQTEIEVPAFTQNRAFFGPGPHFVPATAYSIRVPFYGRSPVVALSGFGFWDSYRRRTGR